MTTQIDGRVWSARYGALYLDDQISRPPTIAGLFRRLGLIPYQVFWGKKSRQILRLQICACVQADRFLRSSWGLLMSWCACVDCVFGCFNAASMNLTALDGGHRAASPDPRPWFDKAAIRCESKTIIESLYSRACYWCTSIWIKRGGSVRRKCTNPKDGTGSHMTDCEVIFALQSAI